MPSSMTHTYFGRDVYNKLPNKYKSMINSNLDYFELFCQGPDPFMFFHFLVGPKAKEMIKIQNRMHTENTQEFFLNIVKYIHDNKLLNNKEVMSYLYGYICHYFLDLYTHPFIYYKSGVFNSKLKNTYKYNGLHQKIEYAIDIYFISKRENIIPNKFKIHDNIFKVSKFSPTLEKIINYSIGNTYNIRNSSSKYLKSIKYMKLFFYLFNYDYYGIKLNIYNLIDKITPKNIIKIKELSYYNIYSNINDYLNLSNNKWNYPWDKSKINTSSFLDLYNTSIDKSIYTIKKVTDLLNDNTLDIKQIKLLFNDLSYVTGEKCNKKLEMKYFEF